MLYSVRKTQRRDRRRGGRTPWVLRWHDPPGQGRERQRSIGPMSERMAERYRQALQADLSGCSDAAAEDGGPTWAAFERDYLASAAADLKPPSVAIARQTLRRYREAMRPRFLADVTRRRAEEYRVLRAGEVAPETVRKDVRTLRAALEWAVQLDLVEANPFARVRFGRREAFDPDALDPRQTERFLKLLTTQPTWVWASLRIACLWGPRAGELARLVRADVDAAQKVIRIASEAGRGTPKGGRGRAIPLDDESGGLLQELSHRDLPILWGPPGAHRPTGRGRGGYTRTLAVRCRGLLAEVGAAPRDDKPLQFLRRTAETNLRRRGVPDWMIGAILGHGTRVGEQWYDGMGPVELAAQVAALAAGKPRPRGADL